MSIPPEVVGYSTAMLAPKGRSASGRLDVERVREDFPLLRQKIHGKPLIYLDNAATTQKPRQVLDALTRYYSLDNANVHRAVHQLSERATRALESARLIARDFFNATSEREIIFVRGATEGINLVAQSWGRANLKPGDEVLLTTMEHHSNIVPWQMVCEQTGARVRPIPISDDGELLLDEYENLLSDRTKLVAAVYVSNSLGTVNPVERIIEMAQARGAKVLLDAAQAAPHMALDVQALDCDFLVCSGHKLYGPTGIGVLYGKEELLEAMPPWMGGGDMIRHVSFGGTTYADLPSKFEAGTPHIAGIVGLGAAMAYLRLTGLEAIAAHEDALLRQATELVRQIPGVRIIGDAPSKAAVLSFVVEQPAISALDVGTRLDLEGIAVRTGHHCCQPVMERFGIPGTARASFALYNTADEVETFARALRHIVQEAGRRRLLVVEVSEPCPAEASLCHSSRNTCPPKTEIEFAPAMGTSPQAVADEIADAFEMLEDWADRYQYIIELGEKLPAMPEELKTECTRVHGCQSTVYLTARQKPGTRDVLEFLADSDAELVRGLIGVLEHLFSAQKARDVLAFDIEGFFRRIGLDQHLSLNRRNGLSAMVQRVRQHAAGLGV